MIESQSNIAALLAALGDHARRAAANRAQQRRRDLAAKVHPWRSSAFLWPNF